MKKLIIFTILIFSFADLYANDVNTSCFYYFGNVKVDKNLSSFLLNTNKNIDFAQNEKGEVYIKLYKENEEKINYVLKGINYTQNEINSIKDNNSSTFLIYNIGGDKIQTGEIIFDFQKEIGPGIKSQIYIDSLNYALEYYISDDGFNFQKISLRNLDSFSFRYFKLKFVQNNENTSENIKIKDIIFSKVNYTYLVKGNYGENLKLFSSFFCSNDKDYSKLKSYNSNNNSSNSSLIYTSGLKQYFSLLSKNINYDLVDLGSDLDGDGIIDEQDNCKYDFNPNQLDTNTNGIGDLCDDDDNDGIVGKFDNCPYIYNSDQKDINNNGVGDVCEFDKDNDGIFDSLDNCINIPNFDQNDTDRDGIGDVCDNCKLYNPNQRDVNSNGIGDACEEAEKFALENDEDKDGVLDYKDNCINIPNFDQNDTDKDGIGDACDNCKDIQNPNQEDQNNNQIGDMCEDVDGDSYIGYLDNCPYVANSGQEDQNNNQIGDLCEDDDFDGILNVNDNCRYTYNPDQKDLDGDGIGDVCDKIDDRFIESNKYFFIASAVFFFLFFNFLIYLMFKKMKKIEKNAKDKKTKKIKK